jgi:hypothetical protein
VSNLSRRCQFIKADATRCGAKAFRSSQFCFVHDPSQKCKRDEGPRAGGLERSRRTVELPPDTPDLHLNTVKHVLVLLSDTGSHRPRGNSIHASQDQPLTFDSTT